MTQSKRALIDTSPSARMQSYLLRSGSHDSALRRALLTRDQLTVLLLHWRFQPPLDVQHDPLLFGVFLHRTYQQILRDVIEILAQIGVYHVRITVANQPVNFP